MFAILGPLIQHFVIIHCGIQSDTSETFATFAGKKNGLCTRSCRVTYQSHFQIEDYKKNYGEKAAVEM